MKIVRIFILFPRFPFFHRVLPAEIAALFTLFFLRVSGALFRIVRPAHRRILPKRALLFRFALFPLPPALFPCRICPYIM